MTAMAQHHGALDTRPATPSGLDGPGMSSSAYDLAVLFRAAMSKPLFVSTIETRIVPFPGYGDKPGFMLGNNDRFVPSYKGAIAAKSGFTDAARHTLVATAQRGNRRLVVALMRGEQHPVTMVAQAAALLDRGFATPPSTTGVGTLVDGPPAPPAPTTAAAAPSASAPTPGSSNWPIWAGSACLRSLWLGRPSHWGGGEPVAERAGLKRACCETPDSPFWITRPTAANRPTHCARTPDSPCWIARLTVAESPDSPWPNARLTVAERPTHRGRTPDSPCWIARLTVAERPTHRGETPDSP